MTSPHEAPIARRGFHLSLPDAFTALPLDDIESANDLGDLTPRIAKQFGLAPDEDGAVAAADAFAQLGSLIGDGGVDYAAVAYYKSPDDPLRPIMVALTGIAIPSDHHNISEAVTSLVELHSASGADAVEELRLPSGPAVATVAEEQNALVMNDIPVHILTRQLSAWVPDRDGTTIGVVSVITNSFQDWERVCVLGLEIFDTFGWEPLSG